MPHPRDAYTISAGQNNSGLTLNSAATLTVSSGIVATTINSGARLKERKKPSRSATIYSISKNRTVYFPLC